MRSLNFVNTQCSTYRTVCTHNVLLTNNMHGAMHAAQSHVSTGTQRKRVQLRALKFLSTHVERYFEDARLSSSDENLAGR